MDEQRQVGYRIMVGVKLGNFTGLNGPGNAVIAGPALLANGLRDLSARTARTALAAR